MSAIFTKVYNRGTMPQAFCNEVVAWAKTAPDVLFDTNTSVSDIYSKVKAELGPWEGTDMTIGFNKVSFIRHRKAVMLEVLRVLAGFESSWKWNTGVDESKAIANNNENAEAGPFQPSWDARKLDPSLFSFLKEKGVTNGIDFQSRMKSDHPLAIEFEVRLLRVNTKHNGPLYKGAERKATWPKRPSLWREEESIYPWLSRDAVKEFQALLA